MSGADRADRADGADQPVGGRARGGWRDAIRRLLDSQAEIEAREERKETELRGCTALGDVTARKRAQVSGVLRSVTLRPRENVQALEAELYDGSGSLRIVWLGRREIAGVEPGRRARLEGLVCLQDGRPTMFNPRYELSPRPGD